MGNKAYKFRIYPNDKQAELINKTFGCTRFIWNVMLAEKIEVYENKPRFSSPGTGELRKLNLGSLNILSKLKVNVILLTIIGVGLESDLGRIKLSGIVK